MKRYLLLIAALLLSAFFSSAQDQTGIPEEVFYLMPAFGKGTVYFKGKNPAQGQLNICAVDGSVRFKDRSGVEMEVDDGGSITHVEIAGVDFVKSGSAFWRIVPVKGETAVAVKREVNVLSDTKTAAYGGTTQTTASQDFATITAAGMTINLDSVRSFPYREKETFGLYVNGSVQTLNKKNLQKFFPDHKADIEAWFKANKKLPTDIESIQALVAQWVD